MYLVRNCQAYSIRYNGWFCCLHTGVFIYRIYLFANLHLLKSWRICPTLTMAVSDPWIFHAWVLHCISHSLTSLILPFWSFYSPIQLPNSRCTPPFLFLIPSSAIDPWHLNSLWIILVRKADLGGILYEATRKIQKGQEKMVTDT